MTNEELEELDQLLQKDTAIQAVYELMEKESGQRRNTDDNVKLETFNRIINSDRSGTYNLQHKHIMHRVHFLRTAWFRYAAAIIFIIGVGAYL